MPQAVAIADALKRALRARGITYAALAARIGMSEASVTRMFAKRTFAWIPNGPIMQAFKRDAADFFDSDFGSPGEPMLLLNGRLSHASTVAFVERLKRENATSAPVA